MADYCYRGILEDYNARFVLVETSESCATAITKHQCDPLAGQILCRSLTAGYLLAPLLSDDERYSITWKYNGPVGRIMVELGAQADGRGMTSRKCLIEHCDSIADAYGDDGELSVIKSKQNTTLSSSLTKAQLMDASDDLAFFFSTSEQVETEITVALDFRPDPENPVSICRGLMIQALPDCDLAKLDQLRVRMKSSEFRDILADHNKSDSYIERILQALQDSQSAPYSINACHSPKFQCHCSEQKMFNALSSLGLDDLQLYIDKEEDARVSCHFCSTTYNFANDRILSLIERKKKS